MSFLLPGVEEKVKAAQKRQKKSHDRGAKEREFSIGDRVLVKNFTTGPKWLSGVVTRKRGPVAVEVKLSDGRFMRRHYDHIRADFSTTVPVTEEAVIPRETAATDVDYWYDGYTVPERPEIVQEAPEVHVTEEEPQGEREDQEEPPVEPQGEREDQEEPPVEPQGEREDQEEPPVEPTQEELLPANTRGEDPTPLPPLRRSTRKRRPTAKVKEGGNVVS